MSFSGDVKDELTKKLPGARHCQIAELAAMYHYAGQLGRGSDGTMMIGFAIERESIVRKGFTLLKKTYNIYGDCSENEADFLNFISKMGPKEEKVDSLILKNSCCQRAFIRGAFLAVGSISDPSKAYHMEFVCENLDQAQQLRNVIAQFGVDAKIIARRDSQVVYLKEGEGISLLLNVMEAPNALMELENTRIYKEVNNSVNRRVNCEMSNIRKIVDASTRQIEDIIYIRDNLGFSKIPESLKQMAEVRLEFPEAPLQELGEHLDPPVGKSGVNHRLRRLSELADKLREERGEA